MGNTVIRAQSLEGNSEKTKIAWPEECAIENAFDEEKRPSKQDLKRNTDNIHRNRASTEPKRTRRARAEEMERKGKMTGRRGGRKEKRGTR